MSDDTAPSTRAYRGSTNAYGDRRVTVSTSGTKKFRDLSPRHDLRNHSPTGFNWGYGGSGPAQLALPLLADALNDNDRALAVDQDYRWRVDAPLDNAGWKMTAADVVRVVNDLESRRDE